MITITKELNTKKVEQICEQEGIPYTAEVKVYTASDKDEVFGYSLFKVTDELYIINVETNKLLWNSIGDGLFRATVNFAVEHEITRAVINKKLLDKLNGNIIPPEFATEQIDDCESFLQNIKRCGK